MVGGVTLPGDAGKGFAVGEQQVAVLDDGFTLPAEVGGLPLAQGFAIEEGLPFGVLALAGAGVGLSGTFGRRHRSTVAMVTKPILDIQVRYVS